MRDHRFVAEHRGSPLSKHDHRLMALWAAECAEHVLAAVWKADDDRRPFDALRQARAWARGEISVGHARQAAVAVHAAARESKDAAATAAARAAGHAAGIARDRMAAQREALGARQQAVADADVELRRAIRPILG